MIRKQLTKNYRTGRGGEAIRAIVLHKCEGGGAGCLSWVCNPTAQVSYHYIILENGEVVQTVEITDTAWHAGRVSNPTAKIINPQVNPNKYTVGISLAGYSDVRHNNDQMLSLIKLLDYLQTALRMKLTEDNLIYHSEIADYKKDPGPFVDKTHILAILNILNS